jgi:hypothetical protein
MSKAIVSPKNFDVTQVSFTPLKMLDSGGKQAFVNYTYDPNTRKNLTVQVSTLPVPYGMNVFDKAGPVKYSVDLSLRGYDENPKVKQIFDMFTRLDEYMIEQGMLNSKAWFKADLTKSPDVVKAFYTPIVRWAKDAEGNVKPYPPTIKVQLRQRDGKFDVETYDENKNELKGVPLDELLVKGSQITTLIQCTSVWFAGSKFGLSWKALQIRMDKMPDGIRGYAIQDEDDDAPAKPAQRSMTQTKLPQAAPAVASANKFSSLAAHEEEDGEDDAAFSAPAKAQQSVLNAMMPQEEDDAAEDVEPVKVPAKTTTVTAKKIIKKAVGK